MTVKKWWSVQHRITTKRFVCVYAYLCFRSEIYGNQYTKLVFLLYIDHPWRLVACIRDVCSVEELIRCCCVQVCRG